MKNNIFSIGLFTLMLMAISGAAMSQSNYEPFDFSAPNADGDTLYYRITSNVEPYTVAVTRCHDSTFHLLPIPVMAYEVGQEGFVYPVYDYDTLINIPSTVTDNNVTYTVTSVDKEAFYMQKGLRCVNFPSSVKIIDTAAFYMSSLSEIALSEGLEQICYGAFTNCHQIVHLDLPMSLQQIGELAFLDCEQLQGIVIPSQVQQVGREAFGTINADQSCAITMEGITPPQIESSTFMYDTVYCSIPYGSLQSYQTAWGSINPSAVIVFTENVSVEEHPVLNFSVYPNPAHDRITLALEGKNQQTGRVEIIDVAGVVVWSASASTMADSQTIDVSRLTPGLYLVRYNDEDGTIVQKFVKE